MSNLYLLEPWDSAPHGGPPLDRVRVADFAPAFAAAMEEQSAAIERIVADPAPPDFENTIAALERAGRSLYRVGAVFTVWSAALSTPELREVEGEIARRRAAFDDRVVQDQGLFRRIDRVYRERESAALSHEQARLTWLYHSRFVRSGARLDGGERARLTAINQRLAELFTVFGSNLLADEHDRFVHVEDGRRLAGVPDSLLREAREAARLRGLDGWVIANRRSAVDDLLALAEDRAVRREAWEMFTRRGEHAGEHDNRPIVREILALRAERARLLGFASHAHLRLDDSVAGTPERAMGLLEAVRDRAAECVAGELAEMQAAADDDGIAGPLAPWDHRFYAARVRRERLSLDPREVREHLQLDRLVEGTFWIAGELFGLRFLPAPDVPVHHPDVRVWRVEGPRRELGLFFLDPFARTGKRAGATMNLLRPQERMDGEVSAVVLNICNFTPPPPGSPALVSWEEARVLFHEMGHALHGLASEVTYPSVSGTDVPRDYVEFPSQLFERWLRTPELLGRFARHVESGETIPGWMVDRLEEGAAFHQGLGTTEYLASALLDLRVHTGGSVPDDLAGVERAAMGELGIPAGIGMLHRLPHFRHAFGGDAYSAGFYSYLWADALAADAAEAFTEAGGLYDGEVARRLWDCALSAGNAVDPVEGYRRFRGRDPDPAALLRKRGFV